LLGIVGNVLVLVKRILLTQICSFVAGRDSRAIGTHPGIHLFPSGDSGSSGSPPGVRICDTISSAARLFALKLF